MKAHVNEKTEISVIPFLFYKLFCFGSPFFHFYQPFDIIRVFCFLIGAMEGQILFPESCFGEPGNCNTGKENNQQ
jgi:hypothetical protein